MMKINLLSILAVAIIAFSANAQIPTTGLVGHYDFNNGALTDNINNVSFTKTGSASTNITDRFGVANGAISLNGDDLLRSDINFNISSSNPYLPRTVSFWIKTSTNDANPRLIYNDNNRISAGTTDYIGLIAYLQNGQIIASNRVGTNGNFVSHSVSVNDNVWHHVVIQGYSTQISSISRFYTYVYIDGVKEGGNGYQAQSTTVSVTTNAHSGSLGFSRLKATSLSNTDKYLDGLDEALFYTRILTDSEVSAITNATCNVNIPDANFKAYLVGNTTINTNGDTEIQCSEATAFNGTIDCNGLSVSDVTGIEEFTALTKLYSYNNQLTSLDVSANTALTHLTIYNNQLTGLDLTANTALTYLNYSNNQITNLDLSNNTALEYLFCNDNQITSLDISANTALVRLSCTTNQITSLDVSANTVLDDLNCSVNQITSLDVSVNTALTKLYCGDNSITDLDISSNTSIEKLFCNNNQLTSLNIANTNNANITNMFADNNPNLTCIEVDAVIVGTTPTGWQKDAGATYNVNCGSLSVDDFSLNTVSIYPNPTTSVVNIKMNTGLKQATVYSMLGKQVLKTQNNAINVSGLSNGMYVITIEVENGNVSTKRFIKQ